TGALQCPAKDRLLTRIAEAGEPQAITRSTKLVEEGSDSVGASEPNNPDPRRFEVDPPALSQGFDRQLIARAFDDKNRAHTGVIGPQTHRRHHRHANAQHAAPRSPEARSQRRGLLRESCRRTTKALR